MKLQPTVNLQLTKNLQSGGHEVRLFGMYQFSRLLQFAGLAVPPLAMAAQLAERISTGEMLKFLIVSVCLFGVGYLLQQYASNRS